MNAYIGSQIGSNADDFLKPLHAQNPDFQKYKKPKKRRFSDEDRKSKQPNIFNKVRRSFSKADNKPKLKKQSSQSSNQSFNSLHHMAGNDKLSASPPLMGYELEWTIRKCMLEMQQVSKRLHLTDSLEECAFVKISETKVST